MQPPQFLSLAPRRMRRKLWRRLGLWFVVAPLLLLCSSALATTVDWIGVSGDDWNIASDWNMGMPPGMLDDVVNNTVNAILFSSGDNYTVNSFTNSNSGAFNMTGGSLTTTNGFISNGAVTLSGGALTANTIQVSNTFTLSGGTISNSTINSGASNQGLTIGGSGGTLSGTTLNATLTDTSGGNLYLINSTLAGSQANFDANASLLITGGLSNYNVTNTTFATNGGGNIYLDGGSSLTIGNGSALSGQINTIAYNGFTTGAPVTLTNNGAITLNSNGQNTTINVDTFNNNGSLNVSNSSTASLNNGYTGGAVMNSGTIDLTTGGILTVSDTLTNTGTVMGNGGTLSLNGGTLTGSSPYTLTGATLNVASSGSLSNTSVTASTINNTSGGALYLINSTLAGSQANFDANASLLITGGLSNYNVANTTFAATNGGGNIYLDGGSSLTIGNGSALSGQINTIAYNGFTTGAPVTLTNNGAITFNDYAASATIGVDTFNNNGSLNVSNGSTASLNNGYTGGAVMNSGTIDLTTGGILTVSDTLTNTGTVMGNGGTLSLNGGTLTGSSPYTLTGATLNVASSGSLSNTSVTASTINNTSGGALYLINSTLAGSQANFDANASLLITGGLSNYNVANTTFAATNGGGNIYLDGGSSLTIGNGSALSGQINTIAYNGFTTGAPVTLTNNGAITLNSNGQNTTINVDTFNNNGSLNVSNGSAASLNNGYTGGAVTNAGTISVGSGSTLTANVPLTQTAGKTHVDGALVLNNAATLLSITGGVLSGSGTVQGNVDNTANTTPGAPDTNTTGKLTVTGDLTLHPTSVTTIYLGGLTAVSQYDVLAVNGTATLDGVLDVGLINGFQTYKGTTFDILDYGSRDPGTGLTLFSSVVSLDPNYTYSISYLDNMHIAQLTVTSGSVPGPDSVVVMGMGISLLGMAVRRRRRK